MNHRLKVLLCICIIFLTGAHAYSHPTEPADGEAETYLFSDQISEIFEYLNKTDRFENLLSPKIISKTIAISPIKNKCSYKSLYKNDFISELNPLEYLIYFSSDEIRKKVFFSLMSSSELSSRSKAFVSSKFIEGLVNQGGHTLIRELLLHPSLPTTTLTQTMQKYVECLLISGDVENLENFYKLPTMINPGSEVIKIIQEIDSFFPVLRQIVQNFCENYTESRLTSSIYPPFVTFVQTLNPMRSNQLKNTVASSWNGSKILQKMVNQHLEIGPLPANKKKISCWHRINDQLKKIYKISLSSQRILSPPHRSSVLVKRSAESLVASQANESIWKDAQIKRGTVEEQKGKDDDQKLLVVNHNQISSKRRLVMSDPDLKTSEHQKDILSASDVLFGTYDKKESQWLKSIGLDGQEGLYTQVDLPAGKSILVYSGKIYDSEEEIFKAFPEETWDEKRETAYLLDVSDREGRYLYSVSGLEPESGKTPSFACYINHTVPEEANVFFERVQDKTAHKGYRPVIITKKAIQAGSELKGFYGRGQNEKMLEESPEFRQFVENHYPHYLPKKRLRKGGSAPKKRSSISCLKSEGGNVVSPRNSFNHTQGPSKKEFSDSLKISGEFRKLLHSGDELFKKGRTYSDEFQFEQALHQLNEAKNIYQRGFDLIGNGKRSATEEREQTLKYNLDFRLADLYWEMAVNSLFMSKHSPNRQVKLKYSEDEAKYYQITKDLYSEQIDLDINAQKDMKNAAAAEQTARQRIREILENPHEVSREDLELSYETAFGLKEKAVDLIESGSQREKAISLYELALQYISSEQSDILDHGYRQYLEADLNWSLGEVYLDDPMNDLIKARKHYERAILLYQQLLQNHSGISQADESGILDDVRTHLPQVQGSLEIVMKLF